MRSGHIPTGGEFTVYSELVVCTHFLVVTCMQSTQPKSLQGENWSRGRLFKHSQGEGPGDKATVFLCSPTI